ncbi:amino acid adenylation domain-containing protein [Streptomyces sp. NPDC001348]
MPSPWPPSAPVAVIGMALRLPGADSAEELHELLRKGHDAVGPVPETRLALAGLPPSGTYPQMATLDGIDEFDREFFGITPAEAEAMDPHQRLTLELAWAAFENAGYRLSAVRDHRCGVFLSAPRPEYSRLVGEDDLLTMLGTASPALAGRVAHTLGLHGPAVAVDTGCSASLVAVHYACRELAAGTVGVALAGGLSLHIIPLEQSEAEAFPEVMSAGGRCRAFDASASGTCQGEGGGLLVLKLLDRALADGDTVHAVIRGIAVNHNGGRSTGLSAPGPAAQAEVIEEAWRQANLNPRRMSMLEAHGSGTRLGDMIELEAAQRVLRRAGAPQHSCAVGSVKTNIGHLDHAAGIAGLLKAVLAVRHRSFYPSLHFEQPNPQLLAEDQPLYVNTTARERTDPSGLPMTAGVSSFSLTGTNVHVVVEEPPAPPQAAACAGLDRPGIATVSARSPAALARRLRALADRLPALQDAVADVLFVLNAGREDHDHRLAFPVTDAASLREGIQRSLAGLADGSRATGTGPRRTVLVLGDPGDAAPDPGPLSHAYPAYRQAWQECGDEAAAAFRHHYATAVLLRSLGLVTGPVLGVGRARAVARAVRGELSPATALAEAERTAPVTDPQETDRRARQVVARLVAEEPSLFCVLGEAGTAFVGHGDPSHGHHLWQAYDAGELAHGAAALYAAGAVIDWEAWYAGRRHRRVELPPYPFEPTRCWPRVLPAAQSPATARTARTSADAVPPDTPAQGAPDPRAEMAAIWESALKIPGIGPDADYFELGGNSVLGLAVLTRIGERFGVRLPLTALYEHSTVGALTDAVQAAAATAAPRQPVTAGGEQIPRVPRRDRYLPSRGQESLWFLDRLMPGLPLYNVPVDLHLKGTLDIGALRTALAGLDRRHEVLRTRYDEVDGEPVAVLRPVDEDELRVVDLSAVTGPDERLAQATELLRETAVEPMDLATGPLFKKLLVRLAPDDHVLLLVAHHSVYDGWTPAILDRDLWELYKAALQGREPDLPALPVGYPDYAAWQRTRLRGPRRRELLQYWRGRLAGSVPTELPGSKERPQDPSGRGAHHYFTIPAHVMRGLRTLSAAERSTLFTTMLTALKTLLARYCGRDDIVVGTTTAGRGSPDVLQLIGYFNNAVPLRTDLGGDPTFRQAVARVRNTVIGALDHDELPFAMLVEDLQGTRDRSRHPLFQITYVHQNLPENARDIGPGLEYHPDRDEMFAGLPPGIAKWDLLLAVWEYEGREELPAVVEYSVDLYDAPEIEQLADCFLTLLEGIVADPDTRLSRLALLTPAQRGALLARAHGTAPAEVCAPVPGLLASWAREYADLPGAEAGDARLIAGVRQTAAALRGLGVRPGDTVGVLAGGRDAVTALLAVLDVGGVCALCDPGQSFAAQAASLERSAPVLLVAGADAGRVLPWPGEVMRLDAPLPETAGASGEPALTALGDPAVLLGTGPAAGLLLDHRALAAAVAWWARTAGDQPDATGDDAPADPLTSALRLLGARPGTRGTPGGRRTAAPVLLPSLPLPVADTVAGAPATGWSPLGAPAPGTALYVLGGRLELLPPGVSGDLYVGGAAVGVGYPGRPGDTARDFLPDPFADEPGSRIRRTGDRARVAPGGGIELWRPPDAGSGARPHHGGTAVDHRADGAGPADLLEASLMDVYFGVLAREVGPHDDFFAVGGHSLLVIRVLSEVRRRHGVRLPVSAMFDHRTVRALAGAVRAAGGTAQTEGRAVVLQHRGDVPPLFCVDTTGAGLLGCHSLARGLTGRVPVYGVASPRAEECAAAVRAAQPEGPYRLLGLGTAGVLTLQVARRLTDEGATVEFVGLVDPPAAAVATGPAVRTFAGRPGRQPGQDGAALAAALLEALAVPSADEDRAADVPAAGPAPVPAGPARAELLPDRVGPDEPTGATTMRPYRMPAQAVAFLARPSDRDGVPLAGLLASVAGLLARLTGEADVVIGVREAGRPGPVAVRVSTGGGVGLGTLTDRAETALGEARPLPRPQGRTTGRNPLFSVAVEVGETGAAAGLETAYGRLDAVWRVRTDEEGTRGTVLFDADRFRPRTAKRLVERWRTLLLSAAAADTPLDDLPLMDDSELHGVLEDAGGPTVQEMSELTLPDLVRRRAALVPDHTAVLQGQERLSYRRLDLLAGRLADVLRERGAGCESVVGVCAERSPELVVALLAVLYAGAAYLPLDPEHPAERLEFMLRDSRAALVLDGPGAVPDLGTPGTEHIEVSLADLAAEPGPAGSAPGPALLPDHPAYVMYTSGSTGRPKGVVVPHRGVVNRILWGQRTEPLGADDRILQKTPFGFDVSVPEFFWPLAVGATTVLAAPGGHRDPFHIAELIERHSVTTVHFVPSMLREFLSAAGAGALRGVRRLVCSGEALPADLCRSVVESSQARVLNLYGPTEASIEVSWWDCRQDSPCPTVPIGRPVDNARLHVLDTRMRPCPRGVPGELYIGGTPLARGYLGRPGLTAERFVPSPFGQPGERLYRTGDRCRVLDGGVVEYLGRMDDQLKLRGFRIEPGEIESVLTGHPAVTAAAVVVEEPRAGDQRLVAHLVGSPGPSAEEELRELLAQRLPPYMIPAGWVWRDRLPVTGSGKLDRRLLSAAGSTG